MATSSKRRKASTRISDKQFLGLILLGVALIGAALIAVTVNAGSDSKTASNVKMAADFSLPGLDGDVTLADYRGKVVLVNFWASWCPPCKAEMPDLNQYYETHREDGFVLVAVNMGEPPDVARAFIQANGFRFPVALDFEGVIYNRYGAEALPTSFIIGPDGSFVKGYPAGMISRADLERDVTPLLNS